MGIVIILGFFAYLLCGWLTLKLFYGETDPELHIEPKSNNELETFIFLMWFIFIGIWTVKKLIANAREK